MSWLKNVGKGLGKVGFGLKAALGSSIALDLAETLAKSNPDVPPAISHVAALIVQGLIIYKMANNNPDGTPATTPYKKEN